MISGHLFCHPQRFKQGGNWSPFTQNTPPSIGVFAFDLLLFTFSYFTDQKQKSFSEINLVHKIKYCPLPQHAYSQVMTLSTLVFYHGWDWLFCFDSNARYCSHNPCVLLWFASTWYLFDSRGGFRNKINCSSYCCQEEEGMIQVLYF